MRDWPNEPLPWEQRAARMAEPNEPEEYENNTQRIEAFSDGVFAIAITLLILEIKIPHLHSSEGGGGAVDLAAALRAQWPSYFAYILSFVMIGIYWANHHYIFRLYRRTDHLFNLLNVFFLLCISFLPFPTAVLGDYMIDAKNRQAAVSLYAFGLFLPAFSWFMNWLYGSRGHRLIDRRLDPDFVRYLTRQYLISNLLYLAALVIAFFLPLVSLAINVGLTMLYLLPPRKPVYRTPH
jgi:uncharacterized membrane protein